MLDRMSLLFRFQAIAEAGSLRKAAESLNITQPALTRSLAKFESHFGQPLFERHARGVKLTALGARLHTSARRLSRDWQLTEQELVSGGALSDGLLRIWAGPLWAAIALPALISKLNRDYPNLTFEIQHANVGENRVQALLEGRIDLCFGGLTGLERTKKQLVVREFTTVIDRVFARSDHPIHSRDPTDYQAIVDYPWIVYATNPHYEAQTVHSVVEWTGTPPSIRVRTNSLLTTIKLLSEGDYLCILPDMAVSHIVGDTLKPIPSKIVCRVNRSGAIYRAAIADYPPLRDLLNLCQKYFDEGPFDTGPVAKT